MTHPPPLFPEETIRFCRSQLKRLDYDAYLASHLFGKEELNRGVILLTLNAELHHVFWITRDTHTCLIRLQWWRDQIDLCKSKTPKRHSLLEAISILLQHEPALYPKLLVMIESHFLFAEKQAHVRTTLELVEMIKVCFCGPLDLAILRKPDATSETQKTINTIGLTYGLSYLLRHYVLWLNKGWIIIPEDILKTQNILHKEALYQKPDAKVTALLVKTLIDHILNLQYIKKHSSLPLHPLHLLYRHLALASLNKILKKPEKIMQGSVLLTPLKKLYCFVKTPKSLAHLCQI